MAAAPTAASSSSLVSTKTKDYLEVDAPIRGQSYACLSFVCPEGVLSDRDAFFFNRFLSESFSKEVSDLFDNLAKRYPGDAQFIETARASHDFVTDGAALQEKFRSFVGTQQGRLDDEFHKLNDFRTTVRGVKVRGVYASLDEARNRCERLKTKDPRHNIWVGEVGAWLPFADNPEELKDQEYAEAALNTLMKEYNDNAEKRDQHFAERKRLMREGIQSQNDSNTRAEAS